MKRIVFILSLLLLAGCEERIELPLQLGLYKTDTENGPLFVRITSDTACEIYFEGQPPYNGSITFSGGDIFGIKGYAEKPYEKAEPGTFNENWRNIYSFTSKAGDMRSETQFYYFVEVKRPLRDDKTVYFRFDKQ